LKTLWCEKKIDYTGEQLRPLWAYQNHGLLGDSCVVFRGACSIDFSNMVDLEDVRANATIAGSEMLHFILEIFDWNLKGAVALQRLFAALVGETLNQLGAGRFSLIREGDDLYLKDKKLSISIASISSVSCQIHFAMNISNMGTPVPTCSFEDLGLNPEIVARTLMAKLVVEFSGVLDAAKKVKPLI
jgi:uncharacterized protein